MSSPASVRHSRPWQKRPLPLQPPLGDDSGCAPSSSPQTAPQQPPLKRAKMNARGRKQRLEAEAAAACEEDDAPSEQLDRRVSTSGGFGSLTTDLVCLVCAHLDTRELVALRAVSKHWSRASQQPCSWSSSHWRSLKPWVAGAWPRVSALCTSAPHLRSLTLPQWRSDRCHNGGPPPELADVARLRLLERIDFSGALVDSALVHALPSLRHIRNQANWHERGYRKAESELAASCTKSGLVSVCGVDQTALGALSLSESARSLVTLDFKVFACIPTCDLARFQALEELTFESQMDPDSDGLEEEDFASFPALCRSLGSLPALRVLSIKEAESDWGEMVESVLSAPALMQRLEYLDLKNGRVGEAALTRIMTECTALLVLRLDCRPLPTIGEDEWALRRAEPSLSHEEVHARLVAADQAKEAAAAAALAAALATERASAGLLRRGLWSVAAYAPAAVGRLVGVPAAALVATPYRPPCQESDDFGLITLLLGPVAFRRRLLSLSLGEHTSSHARAQCMRRFPKLVHMSRGDSGWSGSRAPTDEWMEREAEEEGEGEAPRPPPFSDAGLTYASFGAGAGGVRDSISSPFGFVRKLKLHKGLPLTASEKSPHARLI